MGKRLELARLLFGADPKLKRMMQYWAATAGLYSVFLGLLYDARLGIPRGPLHGLMVYTLCGIGVFYLMVRSSRRIGLAPTASAVLQGVFGISCNMWAYAIAGPLRGPTLMGLMVVTVFCTFALRPRQTLVLAFAALLGMGGTMWWLQAQDPLRYPPAVEGVTFLIMTGCLLAVTFLTGEMTKIRGRLKAQKDELEAALDTIRTLATIDELTELANRRHMNEVLALEERRMPKHGPTCLALLDIDFFKQINDRHGHAAGDAVLRAFAQAARAELRDGDVLARWGGEEFLLMLPDTALADAHAVLGRARARVAALAPPGLDLERPVTFSAGLSARHGDETLADTISRADKALYQAKAAGRDRVVET
jgi:diguanylate cyclase (GGDEF)-like protein